MLREAVGDVLAKALDAVADDDDSAVLRIELRSDNFFRTATEHPYAPVKVRIWTMQMVDGEMQVSSYEERWR